MYKDDPQVYFSIRRGEIEKIDVAGNNPPPHFRLAVNDRLALLVWLDSRVPDPTRFRLHEDLQELGIPYYSPENILHYNNGNAVSDHYWVRFKEGRQTWKELQDWRGF